MALGKYSRIDGKKSSNYCSTVTVVVFVAVCLVGIWMLTSSSVVPVQSSYVSTVQDSRNNVNDMSSTSDASNNNLNNARNDVKNDNRESSLNDEGKPRPFVDNLPEDAPKKDNNASSNQEGETSDSQGMEENATQSQLDKKETVEPKPENGPKADTENEKENKQGGETKTGENYSDAGETNESNATLRDFEHGNKSESEGEKGVARGQAADEVLPAGAQSELLTESTAGNGSFSTQASESKNEMDAQKFTEPEKQTAYTWKTCNVTAGPDYIPCLDNLEALRHLRSTKHYEHRERHCPENPPTCLVYLPEGYQRPIEWPTSREKIWYHNVPHTQLAQYKGHQNWVKVAGEHLTFPGGGTQFKHGALHYIDFIKQSVPDIAWGKRSRVVLDVGCGVASFGGFLFERDVLTMSFAPKDEHEAQVQFALERGIPAISAVMGTQRLPFPARVFDVIHCARCRVPWHIEGGKLLLELNRLLRPGGFFVWSATPIYQKGPEDVQIWKAMKELTKDMCWETVVITKDRLNGVGIAIYRKPMTNECYERRPKQEPPLCSESDDPSAAWNVPLQTCMHKVPVTKSERGSQWPELWPARLQKPPYWLLSSKVGVYGKPEPDDFIADYEHWKRVVSQSYANGLGINWSTVRNVMDMRAVYGGFAAALRNMKVWVMNIVAIDAPDTLPVIYERGLFGIYHDWCESFSTYPRSYDLLHADHLFSKMKKKCNFTAFVAEVDRILRPEGKLIVRDHAKFIPELESIFKSLHWEIRMTYTKDTEGLLCAKKTMWRPLEMETISYAN